MVVAGVFTRRFHELDDAMLVLLNEFLDGVFAEILPRKQRLQRFQYTRRESRTIAQEFLVLSETLQFLGPFYFL